ncbi:MAG: FxsA family protein [Candidatus Lambdaproteobacteria bacterium]|nr:FxsA family protein [Candidatus Lambdaproteobacteria bacterium]
MLKWVILAAIVGYAQLEVWVILLVNQLIGVWWTGGLMFAGMAVGVATLRIQGLHTLLRIHKNLVAEILPIKPLIDLALILAGSVLIILPGFIGDAVGIVLLLPPTRWAVRLCVCRLFEDYLPPIEPSPNPLMRL